MAMNDASRARHPLADGDEVYEVSLSTDAWDENGLKADAVPLSDEDMAVFNDFLASIQKK